MNKHFEFTGETQRLNRVTLHRIRATRNLDNIGVEKGDLGGWIEHESNLDDSGWVFDQGKVHGHARVFDNAIVAENATVHGNARVSGLSQILGQTQVFGDAWVFDQAIVHGRAWLYGNTKLFGQAQVSGKAEISGNAVIQGKVVVGDNAVIGDSAELHDRARVYGDAIVRGESQVSGRAVVAGNAELTNYSIVSGTAEIFEPGHVMTFSSLGPNNIHITVFRTADGGHVVKISEWTVNKTVESKVTDWEGSISDFLEEVHRRADNWEEATVEQRDQWLQEYTALSALTGNRVSTWS